MGTAVYYIIAIIAAAFCIYMFYMNYLSKKIKQQQLAEFNSRYSGKPLAEQYQRAMAYGAILAYSRSEGILSLVPKDRIDIYRHGMAQQWEITDEQTAVDAINDLLHLQRSTQFDEFIQTHKTHKDLNKIYAQIAKALNLPEDEVKTVEATYAWDVCRAINVSKWCFWIGYITEEQLYQSFDDALNIVAQRGKNWTEYTCSFLLGRCIHGFNLDEVDVEAQHLLYPTEALIKKVPDINIYQEISIK